MKNKHVSISEDNEVAPTPPPCLDGAEHEWETPHSVLGGLRENPGVWGHGGGVVSKEVCRNCAKYHGVDTWASAPDGSQGHRREWYEDADEESKSWANNIALEKMRDIIEGDENVKRYKLNNDKIIVEFKAEWQDEYLEQKRMLERKLEETLHRSVRCYDLPDNPKYEGYDAGYELYDL